MTHVQVHAHFLHCRRVFCTSLRTITLPFSCCEFCEIFASASSNNWQCRRAFRPSLLLHLHELLHAAITTPLLSIFWTRSRARLRTLIIIRFLYDFYTKSSASNARVRSARRRNATKERASARSNVSSGRRATRSLRRRWRRSKSALPT
jgi:hypothetical protein